jgi:hypothetical protein
MRTKVAAPEPASHVTVALWVYTAVLLLVGASTMFLYWHRGRPYEIRPFYARDNRFGDLTPFFAKTAHLYHASAALGSSDPRLPYPAPAYFVYKAILHLFPGYGPYTYIAFLIGAVLVFATMAVLACRGRRWTRLSAATAIVATAAFGVPLWYAADVGNIEGVVWAIAAAGLCFLLRGKYAAAAVPIGVALAIKPFPILLLLLLAARHRYKEAALGLLTAGALVLTALTVMGPNPLKAYRDLNATSVYVNDYIANFRPFEEERMHHSLLDGMKSAVLIRETGGIRPRKAEGVLKKLSTQPGGVPVIRTLVRIYPLVAITGLGLMVAVFYEMPMLNQLIAAGVAITLFPPQGNEYTLLSLYVPFGAFVVFLTRDVAAGRVSLGYRSMLALAVLFGLLFAPSTLLMIYAGDAQLLLLIALLVVAARTPMPSTYFGDPAGERSSKEQAELRSEAMDSASFA